MAQTKGPASKRKSAPAEVEIKKFRNVMSDLAVSAAIHEDNARVADAEDRFGDAVAQSELALENRRAIAVLAGQ